MSLSPISKEASNRTNAARQKRWRSRQRALKKATTQLQQDLGREPTEAEVYQELEKRLESMPAKYLKATLQDEATATVSFGLMVASKRHEVFDMLMKSAEGGDVSSILFLASRLMPTPKAREFIKLTDLEGVDLSSSAGVEKALEAVLHQVAAGHMPLGHGEAFGRLLLQRLELAERSERAAAYGAARAALEGEGGMAVRLETLRQRLALVGTAAAGDEPDPDREAAGWR
jgi:hypothetical protein